MNLHQTIKQDYFSAMKNKDKQTKAVLSLVLAKMDTKAKEEKVEFIKDGDALSSIQTELKQISQSVEASKKAKSDSHIEKYEQDANILSKYLPKQLTQEEVNQLVAETVSEFGNTDFKFLMSAVGEKAQGRTNNKAIAAAIKQLKE